MKPINRMYLISILLFVGGICGFCFSIGWIISTIVLVLGIVMFFVADAGDVRSHEFESEPQNFGKKNPYKAA